MLMTSARMRWSAPLIAVLAMVLLAPASPASAHPEGDPDDGKAGSELPLNPVATSPLSDVPCEHGMAGIFPCENVDLESFLPLAAMGGGTGNDIWGWTDPANGDEYALMGTSNGTSFVDVSDPQDPAFVGKLPTQSAVTLPLWRDIKVFGNYAFVVSEHDNHGMQIFDLTRLRDPLTTPAVFTPDAVYGKFSSAHNVAVNEDTGFAYAVGTNTCAGGLHMIDVNDPLNPEFAGCFAEDGYTHDVECVTYSGPDRKLRGNELCFASNEDTVTIVDVTDKSNPQMLSRTGYPTAAYTHQGSLTPDHRWFLFGDELDEIGNTTPTTTTYIMDVAKPADPGAPVAYLHDTPSIDHNLYIHGRHVYQSNYTAGLRILEQDPELLREGQLNEVAFFDVVPATDIDQFAGTWSNFLFEDSGTVVVSTLESGLFVLRPQLDGEPGGPPRGKKPGDRPGGKPV
jgi:choice-of-anchor B domain-containing protein